MNRKLGVVVACAALLVAPPAVLAQDENEDNNWLNDTELSLVSTQGNSEIFTLGLKNLYQKWWGPEKKNLFGVKFEATRSDKADPREVDLTIGGVIDPIFAGDPCASPNTTCVTVDQPLEDNIERYLLEGRFDQKFSSKTFWYVLGSYDRNLTDGSGIENRYIGTAGVGNIWWDSEELKFRTNYGLSYTDREETDPDPAKDDQFMGLRFDWTYLNKWGKHVTYKNSWTINYSLADSEDYNFDMINAIVVSMTERVALSVSLQWLYNNLPPLEDVDLNCVLPDPNDPRGTIPCDLVCVDTGGNIDFQCNPGSVALTDETSIRKKSTDLIFNTSLVIKL